jgi:hypothetical protein
MIAVIDQPRQLLLSIAGVDQIPGERGGFTRPFADSASSGCGNERLLLLGDMIWAGLHGMKLALPLLLLQRQPLGLGTALAREQIEQRLRLRKERRVLGR